MKEKKITVQLLRRKHANPDQANHKTCNMKHRSKMFLLRKKHFPKVHTALLLVAIALHRHLRRVAKAS